MAIETFLPYKLTDYEEAAYLLSKYFIERNFDADVHRSKVYPGGYYAEISRYGLMKNLLGSRTTMRVTFYPTVNVYNEKQDKYRPLKEGETLQLPASGAETAIAMAALENTADDAPEQTFLPVITQGQGMPPALSENEVITQGTIVQIEDGIIKDGVLKEIFTYVLILPALRKLSDNIKIMHLSKVRAVKICESLKVQL